MRKKTLKELEEEVPTYLFDVFVAKFDPQEFVEVSTDPFFDRLVFTRKDGSKVGMRAPLLRDPEIVTRRLQDYLDSTPIGDKLVALTSTSNEPTKRRHP